MNYSTGTVLKAGLLVGTLDITAAFLNTWISSGKGPDVVLKFIASGIFGMDAFSGGAGMVALGLLMHYLIAGGFTWLFFRIYPIIKNSLSNWGVLGVLYGAFIWLVMNLIVLPLSNTPKSAFGPKQAMISAAILMLCIGLPLAFLAQRQKNPDS